MPKPTTYDRKKALDVCARLIEEPHLGLSEILRQASIPRQTFHDWRNAHPELMEAYKAAKEDGFDELAQQCIDIADDGQRDYIQREDGTKYVDTDHISRSRLRVDTRFKLLSKWSGRYADKIQHGNDPDNPMPAPQFIFQPVQPLHRPDGNE